jgi:predicted metal-dependent phosphoesterase TrpH
MPGIEITTAEGDLLALNITTGVSARLSLEETVLRVGDLGGVCVVPHPMAGGLGMKSLSANSIFKALRNPAVSRILVGIEAYNATALDRLTNHYARLLAFRLGITSVGGSDAHVIDAIGLGATEFPGSSVVDLLSALKSGTTRIRRQKEWSALRIMSSWGVNYLGSAFVRMGEAARG